MKCHNHKDIEATSICSNCGLGVCESCTLNIDGKVVCKKCVENGSLHKSGKGNIDFNKVADNAVNSVKEFANSEQVQGTIASVKNDPSKVLTVLGIIALIFIGIRTFTSILEILDAILTFGLFDFDVIVYVFASVLKVMYGLAIGIIAISPVKNFLNLNKRTRGLAFIVPAVLFLVILIVNWLYVGYMSYALEDTFLNVFKPYLLPLVLAVVSYFISKE